MNQMGKLEWFGIVVIIVLVIAVGVVAITPSDRRQANSVQAGTVTAPGLGTVDEPRSTATEEEGQTAVATPWPVDMPSPPILFAERTTADKLGGNWIGGRIDAIDTPEQFSLVLTVTQWQPVILTTELASRPPLTFVIDLVENGGGSSADDYQSTATLRTRLRVGEIIFFPLTVGDRPVFNRARIGRLDPDFILCTPP